MWKNQKGFSLIEAIIIIGILAILAGTAITTVGNIRYARTKQVAEELDSALSKLRLDTMSQGEHQYLYIYTWSDGNGDSYYVRLLDRDKVTVLKLKDELNGNGTRLCGTDVTLRNDKGEVIDKDNYVCIAYKKNGVFQDEDNNAENGTNNDVNLRRKGTNTESIEIDGSGTYTIKLDFETGRHTIETGSHTVG